MGLVNNVTLNVEHVMDHSLKIACHVQVYTPNKTWSIDFMMGDVMKYAHFLIKQLMWWLLKILTAAKFLV